jgi:hypothetical protein
LVSHVALYVGLVTVAGLPMLAQAEEHVFALALIGADWSWTA